MSGIELAAKYSFAPHELGFCGPKDKKSKKQLINKKFLKQFKTAFAYYRLIAKCNNIRDPFDEKVIRAYWIGNKLLENVPIKKFRKMVSDKFNLQEKAKLIPDNALAHHNTQVEIIGAVYSNLKFSKKIKKLCKITYKKINKDFWSFHWNHKCEKLSKKNLVNLKKYG